MRYGGTGDGTYGGAGRVVASLTFTGVASFANGTKNAPSIVFSSETNTGFFWPGAGNLCAVVGGTGMCNFGNGATVNSAQKLGFASGDASSTSADTYLQRASAGVFKFANAGSFTANGSVATTMTSLGPTGSHTTIQTWLTIVDSGGTTRYIPCY